MKSLSIVLTIHNKEWLLEKVINQILNTTTGNYELVFVVDGCTDGSEAIVDRFISGCPSHVTMKKTVTPNVFETRANNAGMKLCTGDRITIIQDDMVILERDWNTRMQKPLDKFSDVFAVTARTAHNWVYNPNSVHQYMTEDLDNCWCDIIDHTDHKHKNNTLREIFAIRSCVNRGPLLFDHETLQKLNYFPEEKIIKQDMDDHYLCFSAYKNLGKLCGLYWINFESQDSWGGTRINGAPAKWLLKANHANMKTLWRDHKDVIDKLHNEERVLL